MLHGWILEVTPGAGVPGYFELTWSIYTTQREGIETVRSQISDDWTVERFDYQWGEDLQDYSGLHGLVAYYRTNIPGKLTPLVRLGRHEMYGRFVFCGQLNGEAIPFHTQDQAYEIIAWFSSNQEHWNEIYTQRSEREAAEGSEAAQANASARAAKRPTRKVVH